MASDGKDRESEVSRTVSAVLYPDLVELGGLVDALEHVASEMGVDLGRVESASSNPKGRMVTARMHSNRGPILIHLGKENRLFLISVEGATHPWAAGSTDDLQNVVGVAGAWRSGVTLRELESRFPFMEHGELAQAQEEGDPVQTQWRTLLREESRPVLQELIRVFHGDPGFRRFFPYLSMGTLCLARDISDRRAGEIRIAPTETTYRVQSTTSGEEREAVSIVLALDAARTLEGRS
ncbi:DUF6193 family natural product biosynthesis protein [Streptomyces tendae]|uniref:DUF6193 family natural product biosynthesis protein n=1 Tax=Streptomyces tendae TaxID=1932 RepID=UPI00365AAF77